jgi:hypothetical protein
MDYLRTELSKAMLGHLRRRWWFKLLQGFAITYLMYLFFFILGMIVTLLVAQPH